MDSLSQLALGAGVAAACVPPESRRRAAIVGAVLGTLPDLDVFIDHGGMVENFTMHRGFSHSLPVLAVTGLLLWLVLRRWWRPVREAPARWLAAIQGALLTHALLDAHTAYGTQLFWPLPTPPVAWATLFIIDPLYTLPLVAGVAAVLLRPSSRAAGRWLAAGLAVSTLYLCWSWAARTIVIRDAREVLEAMGHGDAPVFATPAPFNTLLWRVVAITDHGHLEGLDSLVADDGPIRFTHHPSNNAAKRAAAADVPAVGRLEWFANGFVGAAVVDGHLVIADLRMGRQPDLVFRHVVARSHGASWQPVRARRLPLTIRTGQLRDMWSRIWSPGERPESPGG